MAGTVTTSEVLHTSPRKVVFAWTSSAGGAADGATTNPCTGILERVVQVPGGTTPTDQYDVVVNDADGADVLHGQGADVSNAAPSSKDYTDGLGAFVNSALTLGVTNAGNAKNGETILYFR